MIPGDYIILAVFGGAILATCGWCIWPMPRFPRGLFSKRLQKRDAKRKGKA